MRKKPWPSFLASVSTIFPKNPSILRDDGNAEEPVHERNGYRQSVLMVRTPQSARTSVRLLAVGFFVFFVAAILPRLMLILAGASQADDWAHTFSAHLASYRPVAALELWTMQSLFGENYLTYKLPKILSAIWYALSFTALLRLTLQFGVPAMLFILLGATALMHPIFNELILWGVLSTLGFVTFLGVVGVTLVYVGKSSVARVVGLILLSLGAAGSQIGAAIGAGVVLAELSYRGLRATIAAGRAELLWRLMVVITPPTIAIGVLLLMRFGMGYEDFASRSIGFSSPTVLAWFKDKFYVFSNAFANLYQAPVGIALGNSIALSALWPAVVLPTLTLYCLFIFNGLAKSTSLVYAVTPLAIFGVVLAPLLGATAMPTGYRILGGPVLLLVFGLSIVLGQFWPFAIMKRLIAALLAVCAYMP